MSSITIIAVLCWGIFTAYVIATLPAWAAVGMATVGALVFWCEWRGLTGRSRT